MTAQTEEAQTQAPTAGLPPAPYAGRYRLQGLLGSGATADVHRAVDERLGRPVALKVFRPECGPEAGARFAGEARLLARLDHPGLVTVYDYGHCDGRSHLALELVEGRSLRDVLRDGPLPPADVAPFGAALARALAHVHARGVVHRDVKPANVLVDREGSPRLADFGVSRLVDGGGMTATNKVVGTAAYLAPEQVRGLGACTASDVYALGLLLLECLTGRREYPGPPMESAVARLHRSPAVPGGEARLPTLLRRMTAGRPEDRPDARTCGLLLDQAGTAEAEAPVPAPRRPHRRPVLAVAAGLACAGLACGGATLAASGSADRASAPGGPSAPAAGGPSAPAAHGSGPARTAAPRTPALRTSAPGGVAPVSARIRPGGPAAARTASKAAASGAAKGHARQKGGGKAKGAEGKGEGKGGDGKGHGKGNPKGEGKGGEGKGHGKGKPKGGAEGNGRAKAEGEGHGGGGRPGPGDGPGSVRGHGPR
ncbi:serine/threonine-protein kinase [Streptomyces sp. NPDC001380]|uniref:serine/threonine-protein kinase n=1 Tax=Streptomyces sp. NPDC001380 TaxID=3364566 RepID=UPI00368019F2